MASPDNIVISAGAMQTRNVNRLRNSANAEMYR